MEHCDKHGPYSVLCRECDLETIAAHEGKAAMANDLTARLRRSALLLKASIFMDAAQACNEAADLIDRQDRVIEGLREALAPFAKMRLSTEPEVSDCLHRSAGAEMRRRADALDQRDNDIRAARAALSSSEEDNGRG